MNPEARERAEQEAADRAEEARVRREEVVWAQEEEERESPHFVHPMPDMPPWLFADERSQRKAEAMAREERPWDDYSPWQNEQLFR
jgi:hypothetical protein